jgi:hypothetical protein
MVLYEALKMENIVESITEEDIQFELEKRRELIQNLSLEDLFLRMEKALSGTEVILEGYNLVNNISEGHGIAVAGILMLRESMAEALDWMSFNLLENEDTPNEEESDEL